jgi:CDP-glucose 4,6-dehydratase
MKYVFDNAFEGLPVLVTGHTGFKGSWLALWLCELGAQVSGYSLPQAVSTPSNFELARLAERVNDVRGDVRDLEALRRTIEEHQPRVILHLAAQTIVLQAYEQAKETFDVNVGGTVNLLEAVRTAKTQAVQAVVCITTDKCYENREWIWGYRENDRLGGHDPYSASKAMAELAIASYRRSFFSREGRVAVASARAGNVIGGGDWAPYRLVPDCMRSLMSGEPMHLRNPASVRPWQHVLEPLSGYLWLAVKLLQEGNGFAEAWNLGPLETRGMTTEELVKRAIQSWGSGSYTSDVPSGKVETKTLRLNWDKAANFLNWRPVYNGEEALNKTVEWFKRYQEQIDMYGVCAEQISAYTERARELNIEWAK